MSPQHFLLLTLCVGAYVSAIQSDDFELIQRGLTEHVNTRVRPAYLENALKNYPLPHFLRSNADLDGYDNELVCTLCEIVVNALILFRKKGTTNSELATEASFFCRVLNIEDERVCNGVINNNVDIFAYIIDNNENITGEKACGLLLQNMDCRGSSFYDWTIDIPDGKTVDKVKANATKSFNILHISDIHYDPLYTPGKTNQCGEPLCCQDDQADASNISDTCGYWGDYTDADIPIHTVHNTMDQAITHKFDFVYYTGDIVSHRVWSTSVANNTRVITLISDMFHDYFNVPVYPILGNHEPSPVNTFSSAGETDQSLSTQWLFELVAEKWGHWLTDEAKATILKGGYYSVSPRKGFRVIVLNSNVCYIVNWWLLNEDKDPYGQLAWLVETLTAAEENGESVHILLHVPSGNSECLTVWAREYNRVIDRFANTIVGHFNGHTHRDELLIYYNKSDSTQAVNVAWNGASVTTFDKCNPSYKVYQIDEETYDILNFEEWTFNITLANLKSQTEVEWYKLYSFKDAYGVDSLEPSEIDKLIYRMTEDHNLIKQYYNFKFRNSDYVENNPCDETCQKKLLCDMTTTVRGETEHCELFSELYDKNK